jgi:hypothetical protein
MSEEDLSTVSESGQPALKKRNTWIIVAAAVVGGIVIIAAVLAALVYFDPFHLNLLGRLRGGYDPVAATVPADTDLYFSIDMLKLLSEDTRGIIDAFAKSSGVPEVTNREDTIKQMDDFMMENLGVTFSDDIQPWIGQYLGFSLFDVSMDEYNAPVVVHWIFAVETRDQKASDAFISKLIAFIAEDTGETFVEREYKKATFQELSTENDADRVVIGRNKDMVLISNSMENIQRAVDAQSAESLAKDADYKAVVAKLPNTRLMTAYIRSSLVDQLSTSMYQPAWSTLGTSTNFQNVAFSLATIAEGIRFDMVSSYDLQNLTQAQIDSMSGPGASGKLAESLPQDTFFFVTGKNLDKVWGTIKEAIRTADDISEAEFDESMQMLESEIGINPDKNLFPLLDQEWGLALLNQESTIFADLGVPLGILGVFETSNPDQLSQNIKNMAGNLNEYGLVMADEKTGENTTYYELNTNYMGGADVGPWLAFGVRDSQLILTTNSAHLQNQLTSSESLAQSDVYQAVWKPFPSNMSPIFFLDLHQLIGVLNDLNSNELDVLSPVQSIAMAGSPLKDGTSQWALIIYVNTQ